MKNKNNKKELNDDKQKQLDKLNALNRKFMLEMGVDLSPFENKKEVEDQEVESVNSENLEEFEGSEIEEKEEEYEKNKVKVIVYKNTLSQRTTTKKDKNFLSSNIKNIDKQKKEIELTEEEQDKEKQNNIYDQELNSLLNESNLIEKLANSELSGKAKRNYQLKKMAELGAKPMKQSHDPINRRLAVIRNKKRKVDMKIERAKQEGNYHKSIQHHFEDDSIVKKTRKKETSLKTSKGRFKDGVLYISKNHIKRNEIKAKKSKSGPKPIRF